MKNFLYKEFKLDKYAKNLVYVGDFISKISTVFLKVFRHQKYPYQAI